MQWTIWWTTYYDGSEYTIPLEATCREAAEFAAIHALQEELEKCDWREEDGLTHGTAVYVMWSVRPAGERPDSWDNFDWFFIPPDEENLLRELRRQYKMEMSLEDFSFCGVRPDDHDWEDAGDCQQCSYCGIRRKEVWSEFREPYYVEFRQVYYDLPSPQWVAAHRAAEEEEDEEDEE